MKRKFLFIVTVILMFAFIAETTLAEGTEKSKGEKADKVKMPSSVLDISQDNTYPNPTQDLPYLQPSKLAKELIDSAGMEIENPEIGRASCRGRLKMSIGLKSVSSG